MSIGEMVRMGITLTIWITFMIMTAIIATQSAEFFDFLAIVISALTASYMTSAVWGNVGNGSGADYESKRKNSTTELESALLLLQLLNPDERDAIKRRLLNGQGDGELPNWNGVESERQTYR